MRAVSSMSYIKAGHVSSVRTISKVRIRVANEVRAGDQSQDGQADRPYHIAECAGESGQSDQISLDFRLGQRDIRQYGQQAGATGWSLLRKSRPPLQTFP
jgi:hypothetical protein